MCLLKIREVVDLLYSIVTRSLDLGMPQSFMSIPDRDICCVNHLKKFGLASLVVFASCQLETLSGKKVAHVPRS